MRAHYLLDTNCCIYLMADNEAVLAARVRGADRGTIGISAIVHAELCFGLHVRGKEGLVVLKRLVNIFPVLPFDQAASEASQKVPFKRGRLDRLIAAHALSLDATLVTNNEADFADIPGLKIENWLRG